MKLLNINNLTARKVLTEVRKQLRNIEPKDYWVSIESYTNCREQGFALACADGVRDFTYEKKVAFSEYCRSDDIVIYFGTRKDFAFNTNIPSDEVYENAKFFAANEIENAAKFIVKYLKS